MKKKTESKKSKEVSEDQGKPESDFVDCHDEITLKVSLALGIVECVKDSLFHVEPQRIYAVNALCAASEHLEAIQEDMRGLYKEWRKDQGLSELPELDVIGEHPKEKAA